MRRSARVEASPDRCYGGSVSSDDTARSTFTIRRLVGVYNANGTVGGELAYFIGARLGRAHCPLCDITHGLVAERPEWQECRAQLRAPFDTYHRNDQPQKLRDAYNVGPPIV